MIDNDNRHDNLTTCIKNKSHSRTVQHWLAPAPAQAPYQTGNSIHLYITQCLLHDMLHPGNIRYLTRQNIANIRIGIRAWRLI